MTKRVAIIQSSYLPWKGYFDIIRASDVFVFLDDVQYTRRDWRNRNLIKTANGLKWITIPVDSKNNYSIKIKDVKTSNNKWRADHLNALTEAYKKAPYFEKYLGDLQKLYLNDNDQTLSSINRKFIEHINALIGIGTPLHWSMDFSSTSSRTEKLLEICTRLNATEYISGPSAKDYLDVDLFAEKNITVRWADYSNYPTYSQLYPPFEHQVSILDLLFNEGPNSINFLKNIV